MLRFRLAALCLISAFLLAPGATSAGTPGRSPWAEPPPCGADDSLYPERPNPDTIACWRRLLAEDPDDTRALAGLVQQLDLVLPAERRRMAQRMAYAWEPPDFERLEAMVDERERLGRRLLELSRDARWSSCETLQMLDGDSRLEILRAQAVTRPKDPKVARCLAEELARRDRLDEATAALRAYVDADTWAAPERVVNRLATLYRLAERPLDAIAVYEDRVRERPGDRKAVVDLHRLIHLYGFADATGATTARGRELTAELLARSIHGADHHEICRVLSPDDQLDCWQALVDAPRSPRITRLQRQRALREILDLRRDDEGADPEELAALEARLDPVFRPQAPTAVVEPRPAAARASAPIPKMELSAVRESMTASLVRSGQQHHFPNPSRARSLPEAEYKRLRDHYETWADAEPELYHPLIELAQLHRNQGRGAAALATWQRLVDRFPEDLDLAVAQATMALFEHREDLVRSIARHLASSPAATPRHRAEARYLEARLAWRAGRWEDAEPALVDYFLERHRFEGCGSNCDDRKLIDQWAEREDWAALRSYLERREEALDDYDRMQERIALPFTFSPPGVPVARRTGVLSIDEQIRQKKGRLKRRDASDEVVEPEWFFPDADLLSLSWLLRRFAGWDTWRPEGP